MKRFSFGLMILFVSCQSPKKKPLDKPSKEISELTIAQIDSMAEAVIDSTTRAIDESVYSETSEVKEQSPIEIKSSQVVRAAGEQYRSIKLSWKNVSGKKVDAIKFRWYAVNSFGEAADMGVVNGYGGGFTDNPLGIGKSDNGTWSVLSRDAKKVVKAWADEVAYSDGTKWKSKK